MSLKLPTFADVEAAASRLEGLAHRTPVMTSRLVDERAGAQVFFKCENLQRIGAFKFRGATNALAMLPEAALAKGVITHSSGNHGQALALAAELKGVRCIVVMPDDTTPVKIDAVRGYGAEVVFCAPGTKSREQTVAKLIAETGATLVHPYDDENLIAGQGTAALELMQQAPGLEVVMTPVGGGGLLSGTALAVHGIRPDAEIYGAEPELSGDAFQTFAKREITLVETQTTVADGLRSASVGQRNFRVILEHVKGILPVSEAEIVEAQRFVMSRMKLVIEPSSAVAAAALFRHPQIFRGKRVGVIISGGNIDVQLTSPR